jgi:hypothetical protein
MIKAWTLLAKPYPLTTHYGQPAFKMDMNNVVEATTGITTPQKSVATAEDKQASAEEPTLEQEVKQLVGSVSSWWTDFSKRVSRREA